MNHLVINQLHVRRGHFELEIPSASLQPGQVLGVMGKSGSGKSTLLQAVAGFLPLLSGEIEINGKKISHLPAEKRGVALVFQKPWLFEHQTVLENVSFGLALQGVPQEQRVILAREWLKKMEISDLESRRAWEVSGGQAQRVALARAMAVNFPLVLLDEPFSALDAPLRKGLRRLVKQLVQESQRSAILVSHDWKDIEDVADQVLILDQGKLAIIDSPSALKVNPQPEIRAICES